MLGLLHLVQDGWCVMGCEIHGVAKKHPGPTVATEDLPRNSPGLVHSQSGRKVLRCRKTSHTLDLVERKVLEGGDYVNGGDFS